MQFLELRSFVLSVQGSDKQIRTRCALYCNQVRALADAIAATDVAIHLAAYTAAIAT
jgi:hypothetical protein